MKLSELIENIQSVDEEAIIFLEDINNFDSDIILSDPEVGDGGKKELSGRLYYYLIEIFLAKEFIDDWTASLTFKPTPKEIAIRLFNYATNDA
ncbi:hypothetical protein ACFP1I_18360 [Dyadobacter subterraneus]|uniref:Uncharacterized protein n=1 Tax=Dyadobacter subterraneus TaxID=2773304 RepID=A0ABR9WMN1_9BACT|nr:hypothetical protein [Dyadobacter subterraneus]MBE9466638.1 hypothetical protein [Dyadobacter subterraneus]